MLRSLVAQGLRRGYLQCQVQLRPRRTLTTDVRQQDEPLRILFCGSEAFSIASLEALRDYQKSPGSSIASIDVATRKDKAGGRGMKEMRSPPIKRAAAQLGLRVHQFDTFTGWHLPEYEGSPQPFINLVVAVSFGLLVPPRILRNAKYGGLNVHPSMLPDLRGAAPINWSILQGYTHTGVSVQTLHPSKFDHGVILAQTPAPGVAIPNPNAITAHELRLLLAPVGADMLVDAIRKKLYLQPYSEVVPQSARSSNTLRISAPKINPSMKILNPYNTYMETILRKNRAIPKLWAEGISITDKGQRKKRIIFGTSMRAAGKGDLSQQAIGGIEDKIPVGTPFALIPMTEDVHQSQSPLYLKVKDETLLVIPDLLVAGDRERPAAAAAAHAKLFAQPSPEGAFKLYKFEQSLIMPDADTH